MKTILVDDHPLFRQGVARLVSTMGHAVVGEASGTAEGLALARSAAPDLAIVDISLKDGSGIELVKAMLSAAPGLRVIMLSMHVEPQRVRQAFQAGALGYVAKESVGETLQHAIEAVLRGEQYIDSLVSRDLLLSPQASEATRLATLTPRELEILRHVASGNTTKEIALQLYISPRTVENHRANIMRKLELGNTAALVRYAIMHGVVDDDASA